MKIYIIVVADKLDGSETIEKVFSKKESAEKYINICTSMCESEKYSFTIIEEYIYDI